MADTYLQYQSTKQSCTRTDPLADIFENINKNPTAYASVQTPIINNISEQCNDQSNNSQKKGWQWTRSNSIPGQLSIVGKEIQVFQETIKQCFKTVKS